MDEISIRNHYLHRSVLFVYHESKTCAFQYTCETLLNFFIIELAVKKLNIQRTVGNDFNKLIIGHSVGSQ